MARGFGDGVIDQCARERQSTVRVDSAPGSRQYLGSGRWGVSQADLLQQVKGGMVDLDHVCVVERPVPPTIKPRSDWTLIIGKRRRTHGAPRFPAATASRC
jgi:hypothetical protein